jgi:perosamine synthetase
MPSDSKTSPDFIPVNAPVVSQEAKRFVADCMESGWLSSAGPFVARFEREFASYVGTKHGVAVCNGTAALHCALAAAGVGSGDEVIVPAFTMIATVFAVLYTGARPVFVDCEADTFGIDPAQIEARLTPHTRAILPVHLFGHACDMDAVAAVASRHRLRIIEDAAEAHGGRYRGRSCGTLGDASCFSFYANKIITTGEGGMVLTDDDGLADRARRLRDLCHSPGKRFVHDAVGFNYRMTSLQAAVGCGELIHIEQYLARKQAMAARYTAGLSDVPGLRLPVTRPDVRNVFWMYTVLVDEAGFGMSKDAFRASLRERGIDTRDVFYSPSDQPALVDRLGPLGPFPVADQVARTGCYLPSGLALTDGEIDRVIETIRALRRA